MIFGFKIKELQIRPENNRDWLLFLEQNDGRDIDVSITFRTRQRTAKQNNALWLWLTQFADGLNEAGLGMRQVLKEAVMIRWNKDTLHDYILIPILKALTGKDSTTKMDKTGDIEKVWDTLNVHFAEKHNFQIPKWPEEKKDETSVPYPTDSNQTLL
jgi:hypothetical protein